MAPISLLCRDFLRSLLISEEKRSNPMQADAARQLTNGRTAATGYSSESDSDGPEKNGDSAELKQKLNARKSAMAVSEKGNKNVNGVLKQRDQQDRQLQHLLEKTISIDF